MSDGEPADDNGDDFPTECCVCHFELGKEDRDDLQDTCKDCQLSQMTENYQNAGLVVVKLAALLKRTLAYIPIGHGVTPQARRAKELREEIEAALKEREES
jgi:hypothetical protein